MRTGNQCIKNEQFRRIKILILGVMKDFHASSLKDGIIPATLVAVEKALMAE
jgi:hypothetical protein